jgi:hypothetical protein
MDTYRAEGESMFNHDRHLSLKGKELWKLLSIPSESGEIEEAFRINDYWLMILYVAYQRSWELLKKAARFVESPSEKNRRIFALERKLRNTGYYESPEALLAMMGSPSDKDVDDATNWFFNSSDR